MKAEGSLILKASSRNSHRGISAARLLSSNTLRETKIKCQVWVISDKVSAPHGKIRVIRDIRVPQKNKAPQVSADRHEQREENICQASLKTQSTSAAPTLMPQ